MRLKVTIENGRYVLEKENVNEKVVTLEEIARLRKEKVQQRESAHQQLQQN